MNIIRRLNREHSYLSRQKFKLWHFIRGMKVGNKGEISAQYLQNYAYYVKKHWDMDVI